MRRVLWGIVVVGSAAVSAMPFIRAAEVSVGQPRAARAFETSEEAWRQAGVCVAESPLSAARRSFEEYQVDLCGGEPDAVSDPGAGDALGVSDALGVEGDCDDGGGEPLGAGCCGGVGEACGSRRLYVTGIIGASFGTLQSGGFNTEGTFPNTGRAADSLLTAGIAAGMAFDRANGFLRLEVEGRGRDALQGQTNSFAPPVPTYFYSVRAADGWSVMSNLWRDWCLTERLGFYSGGGIGAGGYRLTVDDGVVSGYGHVGAFAWQVGTGTTYRITNRTTIDLGYRFFDTVSEPLPLALSGAEGVQAGNYASNFYASELLLSVRIYEPFRSRPVR